MRNEAGKRGKGAGGRENHMTERENLSTIQGVEFIIP